MVRYALLLTLALCFCGSALAALVPDYDLDKELKKAEAAYNNYIHKDTDNNIAVVQVETKVHPSGDHSVHVNGHKLAKHELGKDIHIKKSVRAAVDYKNDHHDSDKKYDAHGHSEKDATKHGGSGDNNIAVVKVKTVVHTAKKVDPTYKAHKHSGDNNIAVVQVETKVGRPSGHKGSDDDNNIAVVQVKTNVHSAGDAHKKTPHNDKYLHKSVRTTDDKETAELYKIAESKLKYHDKNAKITKSDGDNNIAVVQVQTTVHTANKFGKHYNGGKYSGDNNIAVVQVKTKVGGNNKSYDDDNNIAVVQVETNVHPSSYNGKHSKKDAHHKKFDEYKKEKTDEKKYDENKDEKKHAEDKKDHKKYEEKKDETKYDTENKDGKKYDEKKDEMTYDEENKDDKKHEDKKDGEKYAEKKAESKDEKEQKDEKKY